MRTIFKGYLKGVHKSKNHGKVKLYKIVKNKKGQSDILTLGFIGYLVLMVVVLLCIF